MALAAASTLVGSSRRVDARLTDFRRSEVDLSADDTELGRAIAQLVLREFAAEAARHPHLPAIHASKSFLAGSLGRLTQEQPLDDIDTFVVMNGGGLRFADDLLSVFTVEGTVPNSLASDPRYKTGSWVSAERVVAELSVVAASLVEQKNYISEWSMGPKRKNLQLTVAGVNVDVVPVLHVTQQFGIDRYYLAAGQGSHQWTPTNPKEDQRRLSSLNQERAGELLGLIRLMKWWNANRNADRLKGIHLEVLVEEAVADWTPDRPLSSLRLLFPTLAKSVANPCPDPTGLGVNLDSSLSDADRASSLTMLALDSLHVLAAGVAAEGGNEDAALAQLADVFPL